LKAALGSSLRQATPKTPSQQPISAPIPPAPPPLSDPMAPFWEALQRAGVQSPQGEETQETPQQKRRRLLQAAKSKAIDRSCVTGTVTTEMRAAARLAIERELRDEPLEKFSSQEVMDLGEGVRDRVYSSFWGRQKKETQRTQEAEERKHADQREEDRKHTERKTRKAAFLNETLRRVVTFLKTRSLSPRQRLQVMEDTLTLLDETLTGDEPLPEAYAALDAVLEARVAEWDADEAAREARQQEEWMEVAAVILGIIALGFMYVKVPEILLWLLNSLWPEPANNSEATDNPTEEAPCPPSDQQPPLRRIRRIRRPPRSPAPEPPSSPSKS
jgi:hypothetical protein